MLPWIFFFFFEYFSLRCNRVPIEDFFGLFIPTKWKKKNKVEEKKKKEKIKVEKKLGLPPKSPLFNVCS